MTDAAIHDAVPAPALERRDDMDRLVATTWHGAGATGDNGSARWLVAVDGSACSLRVKPCGAGRSCAGGPPW